MHKLLERCGNPHLSLPPTIHVAGSNGKGSTIAFLAAMTKQQGLQCHVHTSPHLQRLNERYQLAGQQISDAALAELLHEVENINRGDPATVFELLTLAMFIAFSREPADLAIIEVGLGGELDATNCIQRPTLSLITPIALEHTDWLGKELSGIAQAKAGIIKPDCPVFSARQPDEAHAILQKTAARQRAEFKTSGEHFQCWQEDGHLLWQNDDVLLDLPLPSLPGQHQIENADLAIAAAISLGWGEQAIAEGLKTANWPGRLQSVKPFSPLGPEAEVWLDGAHNPHAAQALAIFLQQRQQRTPANLHLVFAMQRTKDVAGFLGPLLDLSPHIHVVPLPSAPSPVSPLELMEKVAATGLKVTVHAGLEDALAQLPSDRVRLLVTGSLYLIGNFLDLANKNARPKAGIS
ncbi:MAG: bifunctional folylpolyglutamate synthase/dihydrofolate synthase [Robiginitomaculum sp.]|nr:MAG: bifunctional folylpolyglutamate synthase/dihydrofolate synthase [Robiginitomaculum sp.]